MSASTSSSFPRITARLLVVLGVCAGALGASGFHRPIDAPEQSREPWSLALFLGGSLSLLGGGLLLRLGRRAEDGPGAGLSAKRETVERIERIRERVGRIAERAAGLSGPEVADELQDLIEGDLFDLTAESETFLERVGFAEYAAIWDGVATGERLLARAWSMSIDGAPGQGRDELEHAQSAFERAAQAGR